MSANPPSHPLTGTDRARGAAADAVGHMCLPSSITLAASDSKPQVVHPKQLVRAEGALTYDIND